MKSTSEGPFSETAAAFAEAAKGRPEIFGLSWYEFAGRRVRVRIAGGELAKRIDEAFAHLRSRGPGPTSYELTVDLWDVAEMGVEGLMSSGEEDSHWAFKYQEGVFAGSSDGRFMGYLRDSAATWIDRPTRRIVGWHASGHAMPLDERSKPLSIPLSVWYNDQGVQVIHAGLVGKGGQGVLIAGPGGSGKTAAALACLRGGFQYLGDDYVGLEQLNDHTFHGHSLYNSVRVGPEHLAHFPELIPHSIEGDYLGDEKLLVPLASVFPTQVGRTTTIGAVLFPRFVGSTHCRLRPITKSQALLLLAYSSIRIPSRGRAFGLDRLGELIKAVPSYRLELGKDLEEVPCCISELLNLIASA